VLDLNIVPSNWLIISFIEQAIKHRITSSEFECKSKKAKLEGDTQDKRRQVEILNDSISSLNDPKGIETTIKEYNDEYEQLISRQRKEEKEYLAKMKAVSDEIRHAIMLVKEKFLTICASEEEKQRLIDEAEEKMILHTTKLMELQDHVEKAKAEYDARNEDMSGADLLGTGTTSADDNARLDIASGSS